MGVNGVIDGVEAFCSEGPEWLDGLDKSFAGQEPCGGTDEQRGGAIAALLRGYSGGHLLSWGWMDGAADPRAAPGRGGSSGQDDGLGEVLGAGLVFWCLPGRRMARLEGALQDGPRAGAGSMLFGLIGRHPGSPALSTRPSG